MMKIVRASQYGGIQYSMTMLAITVALAVGAYSAMGVTPAQAEDSANNKNANVVVQFDKNDVIIRPITFTGAISGLRALQLSGLEIITADTQFGVALCGIEGVGCPASDCFCAGNIFWNYMRWDNGAWVGYMTGSADSVITKTGSVEGYGWGEWGTEPAPAPDVLAAQKGLDWLQASQSITNGGYSNNVSPSLDVMLAAAANKVAAVQWVAGPSAPSLMDYVMFNGKGYASRGVAESGRMATAVSAGEGCWPMDAALPSSYYSKTLGSLSDQGGFLSWGILGSLAIDDKDVSDSVDYLKSLQQPNGGWEWSPGWGADSNSTAIAIQALIASGESITSTEVISGLVYLKTSQNNDGGFPYQPDSPYGTDSDTNSTAWVAQAIMAAGQNPRSSAWTKKGNTPIDFILKRQLSDGSFEYQKGSGGDGFATRQAVQSLLGTTLPIQDSAIAECDMSSTMLPWVAASDK